MKKKLQRIIAILDGTPTSRSPRAQRGQSMVELVLTTPIFIIMLIGLVEVGWFANNYLILSDTVRQAGRYGSIRDPFDTVTFPPSDVYNVNRHDCDFLTEDDPVTAETTYNLYRDEGWTTPPFDISGLTPFEIGNETFDLGYYDGIACTTISNMEPLIMNRDYDDIVISVFSYANLENCMEGGVDQGPCVRVTGRLPHQWNECSDDLYDPFDVNRDFLRNGPNQDVLSIDVWDEENDNMWYGDPNNRQYYFDNSSDETYRGFTMLGRAVDPSNPNCIGSRFSTAWMEERLERTVVDIDPTQAITATERQYVPSHGLVLVEITWHSQPLLGFPGFDVILPAEGIQIHIWGIFPVSAAEPDLVNECDPALGCVP